MNQATLVIMAAGIGSRFGGGIKQLEPVGPNGEIIMDYSIYDAMEAGFDKVVFVIRKDLEKDFKEVIGNRIEKVIDVAYAYQEIDDIPEAYKERFKDRTKPWGTGQAILCCKDVVDSPFLVINADDYYGKQAYVEAYEYLTGIKNDSTTELCMVSFVLKNTLSENGAVTRGICKVNEEGYLADIVETSGIEKTEEGAVCMVSFVLKNTLSENGAVTRGICKVNEEGYLADIVETSGIEKTEEGAVVHTGNEYVPVDVESSVSMNMWGLHPEFFEILEQGFEEFVANTPEDNLKAEYLLPTIIGVESSVSMNMWGLHPEFFEILEQGFEEFVANTPEDNLKAEYLLPTIIGGLLEQKRASVKVLTSKDKWFGVTYKEDKESVVSQLQALIEAGVYPRKLF